MEGLRHDFLMESGVGSFGDGWVSSMKFGGCVCD
jgi:hypothetical protein